MKKEKKCPYCGYPTEESICPACKKKLRGVESIPLESTGLTKRNVKLLSVLACVVLILAIGTLLLISQTQKDTSSVSTESSSVSEEVSERTLPASIMDNN